MSKEQANNRLPGKNSFSQTRRNRPGAFHRHPTDPPTPPVLQDGKDSGPRTR